jgi:hypothetical protein
MLHLLAAVLAAMGGSLPAGTVPTAGGDEATVKIVLEWQQWHGPGTAQRIDDFVRDLLGSLGDRRRLVLASGCNTSPNTPLENLIAFRDAAWKYGRFT